MLRPNEDKEEAKERSKKGEGEASKSSRYHEDGKSKRGPKKNRPSMKTGKEGSRRRLKGYKVAKNLKKKLHSPTFHDFFCKRSPLCFLGQRQSKGMEKPQRSASPANRQSVIDCRNRNQTNTMVKNCIQQQPSVKHSKSI